MMAVEAKALNRAKTHKRLKEALKAMGENFDRQGMGTELDPYSSKESQAWAELKAAANAFMISVATAPEMKHEDVFRTVWPAFSEVLAGLISAAANTIDLAEPDPDSEGEFIVHGDNIEDLAKAARRVADLLEAKIGGT